jgi:predicted DNA-binding transcriptional regulator AlpA
MRRTLEIDTDAIATAPAAADLDHPPVKKRKPRKPPPPIKPGQRLLLKPQVLELLNVGYPTLWGWMREGEFPLPLELGPPGGKTTKLAWLAGEIDAWLASRPRRKFRPPSEPIAPRATKKPERQQREQHMLEALRS